MQRIFEIIGLVAVVASVLLVAYQIQQANQIARATTLYEVVRDLNEFNDFAISNPQFADLLVQLAKKDFTPSEREAKQSQQLAYRFLNVWVVQETAYRNGLFTEKEFSLTKEDVLEIMRAYPGLLPYWQNAMNAQPTFSSYEVLEPLVQLESE